MRSRDDPGTRIRPFAVTPPSACLSFLPTADFADAFAIDVSDMALDAPEAAHRIFDEQPRWIMRLVFLRNALVKPFGLSPGADPKARTERSIGIFPVVSSTAERIVLGFDDSHLNFRVVVDVQATGGAARRITLTTLVHRNNWLGRVYLAVIMPFHKVIAPTVLARLDMGSRSYHES